MSYGMQLLMLLLMLMFPQHHRKIFSPSGNTFTKVIGANVSCPASPCTLPHTFTAGNGVEVTFSTVAQNDFLTGSSGIGTAVVPTACQQDDVTAGSLSALYILSNTGGASPTVSFTSGSGNLTYFELSVSPGPIVFDGCGKADRTTGSATQNMISPTLTGISDAIFQGGIFSQNVSSFTTAIYTTDQGGGSYGAIHVLNSASTSTPVANLAASGVGAVIQLALK